MSNKKNPFRIFGIILAIVALVSLIYAYLCMSYTYIMHTNILLPIIEWQNIVDPAIITPDLTKTNIMENETIYMIRNVGLNIAMFLVATQIIAMVLGLIKPMYNFFLKRKHPMYDSDKAVEY
ncbi:MAG TPA: hypothetical protein C5S51_08245 [Methanosarcinaceae archaeon]|nr:hypothetical protein [Methanosarcinaceae archaeon]